MIAFNQHRTKQSEVSWKMSMSEVPETWAVNCKGISGDPNINTTIASLACFGCLFVAILCWPPKVMSGICLLGSPIPNMSSYLSRDCLQKSSVKIDCARGGHMHEVFIYEWCQYWLGIALFYWLFGKLSCQTQQTVPEKLTANLIAHVMESFLSLS